MTPYRPREISARLRAALRTMPVVILTGMRQAGKTTLLRRDAALRARRYHSLDDFATLEAAQQSPERLLEGGEPVTIDSPDQGTEGLPRRRGPRRPPDRRRITRARCRRAACGAIARDLRPPKSSRTVRDGMARGRDRVLARAGTLRGRDFVIRVGRDTLALEVKRASRWDDRDLKGLRAFLAADRQCRGGVLAYMGDTLVPLSERLWAVPIGTVLS